MSKKWIIVGAGGHGMVVAEAIEAMGDKVIGFCDDDQSKTDCLGYKIIDFSNIPEDAEVVIGVGNNEMRYRIKQRSFRHISPVIHPSAIISRSASIAAGSMVLPGAIVNAKAIIGQHCILNTNCGVDHECVVGDFVHIAPAATLAGNVEIGEGTLIGMGAAILPYVKIGKWCKIGAGAVVVKDVPDGKTVIGVPAKIR
jgi:sugar O-acyltransferase (sialic acid O-acetyltransferase NeuD family)